MMIRRAIFWFATGLLLVGCATGAPDMERQSTPVSSPATDATVQPAAGQDGDPFIVSPPSPLATAVIATATAEPVLATATLELAAPGATPQIAGSAISLVVERGPTSHPEVALTFDAGADRGNTGAILDILAQYGVSATFGLTGAWAAANPELVTRIVAEGHMLINHTWSHRSFTGASTGEPDQAVLTREERTRELLDTQAAISQISGYDTAPYFRPPFGDLDQSVLADVASAGYAVTVMWSCDSLGWNGATVDEILARCAFEAQPGEIVLMHVGADSQDALALASMIESLQVQGFDLVRIDEMLAE